MRYNNYNYRNKGNQNHSPSIAAGSPSGGNIPIAAGLDESSTGAGQSAKTAPSSPSTTTVPSTREDGTIDTTTTTTSNAPAATATPKSSKTSPTTKYNNQNRYLLSECVVCMFFNVFIGFRGGGYGHSNHNMASRGSNRYNNNTRKGPNNQQGLAAVRTAPTKGSGAYSTSRIDPTPTAGSDPTGK